MTREEAYQLIYTHETIYLPPYEEKDAPLEVALGCSWHKCTFCDFTKDKFTVHPIDKIEYNIAILSQLQPDNPRLFLLGENAFCLSTDYLLEIFKLRDHYMPNAKKIAMYARIDDISRKSDDELKLLKAKGLDALHIGMESGSDSILMERKKGITTQQIIHELHRLDSHGIDYYLTIIPGLGGRTFSKMHALETARVLNQVHPKNIWCLKLFLYEKTELYLEEKAGHFDMMDAREILMEERLLLENLTVKNCVFEDTTVLNQYTIRGNLPEQKHQLLNAIDYLLSI